MQAAAQLASEQAAELVGLVLWWHDSPAVHLRERSRRLLSHLGNVGSGSFERADGSEGQDIGNGVYGIATHLIHEECPHKHKCHHVTSYNSTGNLMEGLLGTMWGLRFCRSMNVEDFVGYLRAQGLGLFEDVAAETLGFLHETPDGMRGWRAPLETFLTGVGAILLEDHALFAPLTSKRGWSPAVAVAHFEAIRFGWPNGHVCGCVSADNQILGFPLPPGQADGSTCVWIGGRRMHRVPR